MLMIPIVVVCADEHLEGDAFASITAVVHVVVAVVVIVCADERLEGDAFASITAVVHVVVAVVIICAAEHLEGDAAVTQASMSQCHVDI